MRKVIYGILIAVILVGGATLIERSLRVNKVIEESSPPSERLPLKETLEIIELSSKKKVELGSFRGKVLIINFWASWCDACMQEMPSLNKLYKTLQADGLVVAGINVDDEPEKVIPGLVEKLHLEFPMYSEIDGNLTDEFGVLTIPFTIVVDRNMKIVWSESGERDWATDKVINEITKLLRET